MEILKIKNSDPRVNINKDELRSLVAAYPILSSTLSEICIKPGLETMRRRITLGHYVRGSKSITLFPDAHIYAKKKSRPESDIRATFLHEIGHAVHTNAETRIFLSAAMSTVAVAFLGSAALTMYPPEVIANIQVSMKHLFYMNTCCLLVPTFATIFGLHYCVMAPIKEARAESFVRQNIGDPRWQDIIQLSE